jgi:HEPN domain-containing protein
MGAARILFGTGPLYYDSAGYLAHLAIELLLKVMLLLVCDEFPSEHDHQTLLKLLRRELPDLEITEAGERAITLVNRFKDLRYPRPEDPIEIGSDDADLIVSLYNTIWEFIPEGARSTADERGWVTKGGRVLMRRPTQAETPPNNAVHRTEDSRCSPPGR